MLQFSQFPADLLFSSLSNGDEGGGVPVHSEELVLADRIKNSARKEAFLLGRRAARSVLRKLEVPDTFATMRGSADEPLWPEGVCGSIAHTHGCAVSVVTRSKQYLGVGIDIERLGKELSPALSRRICTPAEEDRLPHKLDERCLEILRIFSAKEALYKAVYPLIVRFLGFRDVELRFSGNSEFYGKLLLPVSELEMQLAVCGATSVQEPYLLSLAYIAAANSGAADEGDSKLRKS